MKGVAETEATVQIGKYHGTIGPKEIAWTKAKSPGQILKPGDLAYFKIVSLDDAHETASLLLEQRPAVEGAIIILQNSTGEIKAMVGGYDFESSEFNRATQAMRQVGSTFKPIVYSTAFEKGMTPDSTVLDSPISFTDSLGRTWQPGNYDGKFKGQITIRQALTESRNVPTIKVASLSRHQKCRGDGAAIRSQRPAGSLSAAGAWRLRSDAPGNGFRFHRFPQSRDAGQALFHTKSRGLRSR